MYLRVTACECIRLGLPRVLQPPTPTWNSRPSRWNNDQRLSRHCNCKRPAGICRDFGDKCTGHNLFFSKHFFFCVSSFTPPCGTRQPFDGCGCFPHFLSSHVFVSSCFLAVTLCPSGCETLGKPDAIAATGAGLASTAADAFLCSISFITGEQEDPEAQQEGHRQGHPEEGQGGHHHRRARRLLQGPGCRGRGIDFSFNIISFLILILFYLQGLLRSACARRLPHLADCLDSHMGCSTWAAAMLRMGARLRHRGRLAIVVMAMVQYQCPKNTNTKKNNKPV